MEAGIYYEKNIIREQFMFFSISVYLNMYCPDNKFSRCDDILHAELSEWFVMSDSASPKAHVVVTWRGENATTMIHVDGTNQMYVCITYPCCQGKNT